MIKPEFDGKRFAYPGSAMQGSRWDVLRWALTRKPARWPKNLPNPAPDPVESLIDDRRLRITYINHATALIQSADLNILTDPVFSRRVGPVRFAGPRRHREPGLALAELPAIHVVLISHTHYDHMDLRSVLALHQRDDPLFIAPLGNGTYLQQAAECKVVELNWWDRKDISSQVYTTLVPARHWTSRRPGDENKALWGGFVVHLPAGNVYFAGDTGYGDGQHFRLINEHCGPVRCALLPIGAYEPRWFMKPQHMNPAEAVLAFKDLASDYALGIHHGTFKLTDEPADAPPLELKAALADHAIDQSRFRTLDNGKAWDIPASAPGRTTEVSPG